MSTHTTLLRHTLIINKLRGRPATLKEIAAHLAQQEEVQGGKLVMTAKTFRRDLDTIFSLYHIDIQYDYSRRVYYIVEDNQSVAGGRLLEAFDTFNALNLTDGLSKYVHFEKRSPLGTENLYGLLHAIRNRLQIKFTYEYYWKENKEHITAAPYALKEFKNRWYVLAKDLATAETQRFALDRMTGLEITKKAFDTKTDYNVAEVYANSFGIIPPNSPQPSEIILSFEAYQGKYIKSLQLHSSQQVITDDEDELRITLKLHITHDFIMELLSYGQTVTVIKPESLKAQMKEELQKALENYIV